MSKIIRMFLFLGIISALSGLAIGSLNEVLKPVIADNDHKALLASINDIFPDSDFSVVDYSDDVIKAVYKVDGKGLIIETSAVGYNNNSPIDVLIGFDLDDRIVAFKVMSQQETNGYGSRCFEQANIEDNYLSNDDVDILSGATLTSKAVIKMVDAAKAYVRNN